MNEKEIWHKWEPSVSGLSKKYSIKSIEDIIGECNIYLYDNEKNDVVRVNFYESTDILRRTNTNYRSAELNRLSTEYGESFFKEWTFFKISNSQYTRDLVEESYGMLDAAYCTHFVFVGSNCIVDVITDHEPKIEFIQ